METITKIAVSASIGFAYAVTVSTLQKKLDARRDAKRQRKTETHTTDSGIVYNITTLPA